jgi:predicted hotdog family 3-hydroxylacyl-ACP dehydratase
VLNRNQIAALLPHDGAMVLLDKVESWSAGEITCSTATHRDADNPLCRDGRLPALCGVEYGAQAMALHGALAADAGEARAGVLASLRGVRCRVGRLDHIEGELLVRAEVVLLDRRSFIYNFALEAAGGAELVAGRATVFLT